MTSSRAHTTSLLLRLAGGESAAAKDLLPLVYEELHALGRHMLRGRAAHTLGPTALIHEAYLRLVDTEQAGRDQGWNGRGHFLKVAANAMRNVLVDHARARGAKKRGGGRRQVTFDEGVMAIAEEADQLLAVDEALRKLAQVDPRMAQIVELRFFAGLNHEEVAEAMETSLRTVERSWRMARAWLLTALEDAAGAADAT